MVVSGFYFRGSHWWKYESLRLNLFWDITSARQIPQTQLGCVNGVLMLVIESFRSFVD